MELSLIFACHLHPGRAEREGSWRWEGEMRGQWVLCGLGLRGIDAYPACKFFKSADWRAKGGRRKRRSEAVLQGWLCDRESQWLRMVWRLHSPADRFVSNKSRSCQTTNTHWLVITSHTTLNQLPATMKTSKIPVQLTVLACPPQLFLYSMAKWL